MKRIAALALGLWLLLMGAALGESVWVCDLTLDSAAEEADLSAGKQSERALTAGLAKLPGLRRAALGQTPLKAGELLRVMQAYPQVEFTYALKMYGQWTAWDAEELSTEMTINNIDLLKEYLRCLPRLKRLTAYGTALSREKYEQLLAEFPGVDFHVTLSLHGHLVATDATAFSTLHTPDDAPHKDFSALAYCKGLRALDLGHNSIEDISFLQELPELRLLVLADNKITDITPLSTLKNLEYLEIFMNRITDISPLAGLEGLLDVNLTRNKIQDMTPLLSCPRLERAWVSLNPLAEGQQERLTAGLPDCLWNFTAYDCTVDGWREHPRHKIKRRVFEGGAYMPWDALN